MPQAAKSASARRLCRAPVRYNAPLRGTCPHDSRTAPCEGLLMPAGTSAQAGRLLRLIAGFARKRGRMGGQWGGSVHAAFARKRAPTGGNELASCTHWSPAVGVRLRTNLIRSFGARRVRSQASSYRGQWNAFVHALCARCRSPLADEPVEMISVPAVFARKRAPTAGNGMVRCPPHSRARPLPQANSLSGIGDWICVRYWEVVINLVRRGASYKIYEL